MAVAVFPRDEWSSAPAGDVGGCRQREVWKSRERTQLSEPCVSLEASCANFMGGPGGRVESAVRGHRAPMSLGAL